MTAVSTVAADPATLARFFRVLGDGTRVRIIRLLEDGERTVGELVEALGEPQPRVSTHLACLRHCGFVETERRVEALGEPQPRVSTHLACLRHCGFVETERRGREIIYRLALTGLEDLLRYAAQVAEPEAERLASCTRIGPDWV
jgi:DNA-binding transcriptional ArsR family regulator